MRLLSTLLIVLLTLAIVAYLLAYTNIYENDVKLLLKNEAYFPGNLWTSNLKSDKDYDGYIDFYKSHLCEHMNETECTSENIVSFCDYDTNAAKCKTKLSPSGNPSYNTDDFNEVTTKLHQNICSGMQLSSCRESSSQMSGFCEVINKKCVPRKYDAAPTPAPYEAM